MKLTKKFLKKFINFKYRDNNIINIYKKIINQKITIIKNR